MSEARDLARQLAALAPAAIEAAADAYCDQSQKRSEMLLLQLRRRVRELDERSLIMRQRVIARHLQILFEEAVERRKAAPELAYRAAGAA